MNDFMQKVKAWEDAWANYVAALEGLDSVWPGEEFVIDCGRAGVNVRDAKNALRTLDPEFCKKLGI